MVQDICLVRAAAREFGCEECAARLVPSLDAMMDEEVLVSVVADLQNGEFCQDFFSENLEKCTSALETVVPTALTAIGMSDRAWIPDFCASHDCV